MADILDEPMFKPGLIYRFDDKSNQKQFIILPKSVLNDISNEVGDVDQSGSINVADIVLIVSIILNS